MGSPMTEPNRNSDEAQRRVSIPHSFDLQATVVTQAQWFAVMNSNPSHFKNEIDCPSDHADYEGVPLCPKLPVENVTWSDAQKFIQTLNQVDRDYSYRLPTEAEWEYAARAGTQTSSPFDKSSKPVGNYAWYYSNSGGRTHSVASLKPSAPGLYDLFGNVWEWTTSSLGIAEESHVLRGGCWDNLDVGLRSARRWSEREAKSALTSGQVGFRLVRMAKAQASVP